MKRLQRRDRPPLKAFFIAAVSALLQVTALAAPQIVSPADYETVSAMSPFLKAFKEKPELVDWRTYKAHGTPARKVYESDYNASNAFVRLVWTGTRGRCRVRVWRERDKALVFTAIVTNGMSVLFYDPEIGRNYLWTVSDGVSSDTGIFYVERNAPRIIHFRDADTGLYCLMNGRDLGGWTNTAGQVVRQGLLYRSAMTEYWTGENPRDAQRRRQPLAYVRDVLGIRLDVDLRATNDKPMLYYMGRPWAWEQGLKVSPIAPGILRFHAEDACGENFDDYGNMDASPANRRAMWHTFTNFCNESSMPILFHCMYGKDRTGTLSYVLLGVLGVPRADLNRDWYLSWYSYNSDAFVLKSNEIDQVYRFLQKNYAGKTLAEKCESYLIRCAADAGVGAQTASDLIARYRRIMLEDPESPARAPWRTR